MKPFVAAAAFTALVASAPAFADSRGIVTPADNAITRSETLAIAAGGRAPAPYSQARRAPRAGSYSSWMQPDANASVSGDMVQGGDR